MTRAALAILVLVAATACTSRTEFGDCIGIADERDPTLTYRLSVWNTLLGIFFVEMIVPPIVVLANETFCPESKKQGASK